MSSPTMESIVSTKPLGSCGLAAHRATPYIKIILFSGIHLCARSSIPVWMFLL